MTDIHCFFFCFVFIYFLVLFFSGNQYSQVMINPFSHRSIAVPTILVCPNEQRTVECGLLRGSGVQLTNNGKLSTKNIGMAFVCIGRLLSYFQLAQALILVRGSHLPRSVFTILCSRIMDFTVSIDPKFVLHVVKMTVQEDRDCIWTVQGEGPQPTK